MVIYQGSWQSISFTSPIPPGSSEEAGNPALPDPTAAVPASSQTAYAILAPGWDVDASAPPTAFMVLESRNQYALDFNTTLRIPVDDTTFRGNCMAGNYLSQDDADYITQLVFPQDATVFRYEAASCATTLIFDGGTP